MSKEGGFLGLGKSKVVPADLTDNYFDQISISQTDKIAINAKKAEILSLVDEIPALGNKDRKKATKQIEQFYKTLNSNSSLSSIFQKEKCIEEQEIPGRKKSTTY